MKILCLTPIKHLDGIYECLESFGKVSYSPELDKVDFNFLNMKDYDIIFCNPNKQSYILDESILNNFGGTSLDAALMIIESNKIGLFHPLEQSPSK